MLRHFDWDSVTKTISEFHKVRTKELAEEIDQIYSRADSIGVVLKATIVYQATRDLCEREFSLRANGIWRLISQSLADNNIGLSQEVVAKIKEMLHRYASLTLEEVHAHLSRATEATGQSTDEVASAALVRVEEAIDQAAMNSMRKNTLVRCTLPNTTRC